jgi:hypothetical protein
VLTSYNRLLMPIYRELFDLMKLASSRWSLNAIALARRIPGAIPVRAVAVEAEPSHFAMLAHAFSETCGPTAAAACSSPAAAAAAMDRTAASECGGLGTAGSGRHALLHAAVDGWNTAALFVAQDPLTWWGQVRPGSFEFRHADLNLVM